MEYRDNSQFGKIEEVQNFQLRITRGFNQHKGYFMEYFSDKRRGLKILK